jgi:hypothetical protein
MLIFNPIWNQLLDVISPLVMKLHIRRIQMQITQNSKTEFRRTCVVIHDFHIHNG